MTYTQPQKAVAVLLAIGQPEAAVVLARLTKAETDRLLSNSRKMRSNFANDLTAIAKDFELAFNRVEPSYDAGSSFQQLLSVVRSPEEKTVSSSENPSESAVSAAFKFSAFNDVDNEGTIGFLANEDIFVSASVLARLPGDSAGEILQMLEGSRRAAIFKAMATMGDAQTSALEAIDEAAQAHFKAAKAASNADKLARLARLLNSIDRESADNAIQALHDTFEEKDISALRSMLFRFEDVVKLEPGTRSAIFDAISADTITLALSDADEGLREAILSSISQRTRRIIENDLKTQTKVNQPAARNAQKLVVSQILELAAVGALALPNDELEAA